jgi:hypothetical protein
MDGPNTDILSRILDIWLGRLLVLLLMHRHRLLFTPKRPTRLLWRDPLDAVVMRDRMLNNHSSHKPDEPRARECLGYNRLEGNGTSRPERLLIWEVLGGHLYTTDNSTLRGTDKTAAMYGCCDRQCCYFLGASWDIEWFPAARFTRPTAIEYTSVLSIQVSSSEIRT